MAPRAPRKAEVLVEEVASAAPPPTLGRILHVNLGPVDPLWRMAYVVDVHRFGTSPDDWSAIAEVKMAPADRSYPPGARMWHDDSGRHFIHVKPDSHGEALGQWRWPPRG